MSGSKSKTSTKSNQTVTPNVPTWIQQPQQQAVGMLGNMVGQNAPIIGPSQLQSQAWSAAGNLNTGSTNGDAQNATRSLMNYDPERLSGMDLSQYMNPWIRNVVDATMGDYQNAIGTGMNAINAQTPTGAFGGARQGVAQGQFAADNARGLASTLAGLYSQGYGNAQNAAMFDINNGMQGAQFRLGAANQLGQQQLADSANSRANIGMLGDMGAQQRQVSQETDPQNAQMQYYANLLRALGYDPSNYIGASTTGNSTTRQSGSSFGISWSPQNGLSIGG